MLQEDPPDVIGFEWEAAEDALREGGWIVRRIDLSPGEPEEGLRVIRQVREGRTVTLTCAAEAWTEGGR